MVHPSRAAPSLQLFVSRSAKVGESWVTRGITGELKLGTCFLNLADKSMGNRWLEDAVILIPKPSTLVLEDVDAHFNEDRKWESPAPIAFNGFIKALDELICADGTMMRSLK